MESDIGGRLSGSKQMKRDAFPEQDFPFLLIDPKAYGHSSNQL